MFEGGCIEKLQEFVPRGPRLGNTDVEDISLLIRVTSPSDYYCADGLRGVAKKSYISVSRVLWMWFIVFLTNKDKKIMWCLASL